MSASPSASQAEPATVSLGLRIVESLTIVLFALMALLLVLK
jgi:hypothetical protein